MARNYQMDSVMDESKLYRYSLTRIWDEGGRKVTFIMLNPSTADAYEDDSTVKKCIGFAKRWGYGSIEIVNLFALRATDCKDLLESEDPVGKENDKFILNAVKSADKVIVGWGNECSFSSRDKEVLLKIADYNPYYLVLNKTGKPRHPLYVKYDIEPTIYPIKLL